MKKILGIISCFVLIFAASITFYACGSDSSKISLTSNAKEIELVLGTDNETQNVEFIVENYGNGSPQVNFSLEEEEKGTVDISPSHIKGTGKTVLTVKGIKRGTATVVATSLQGNQKTVLKIKVIQPIQGISQANDYKNKLYVVAGESLNLKQDVFWNYSPQDTNQKDLIFTLKGSYEGCSIENGQLYVNPDCNISEVTINVASLHNEQVFTEINVKILKPISVTVQVDGKTVVENVENQTSQILNFFEIFPKEPEVSKFPNSLEVVLIVKAGKENDKLNVRVLNSSDIEKFSVSPKRSSYDSSLGIFKFTYLIQGNSQETGKIDTIYFNVSYENYDAGESNYEKNSIGLNINSYDKAMETKVNGQSGDIEIEIYENSDNVNNAKALEFLLSPFNIKSEDKNITIWAENYENLPISFYKLNATRTSYVCVFGYDKKGDFIGKDDEGQIKYAEILSGTTLYVFINDKYNNLQMENKKTVIYAQASEFCTFSSGGEQRAQTKIDFVINPNAKDVFLAEKNNDNILTVIEDIKTIFIELGETKTQYIAIDPNNFIISNNSVVNISNSNLAEVGKLKQYSVGDYYVFGSFELTAKKVGSTTLTIILSDGKKVDFNLVVISPLEEIEITLEDFTQGGQIIESDIVPYKNITDKTIVVGETNSYIELNKLAISNNGGAGIQLVKTPTPTTAQYYLDFEYFDFYYPENKNIKNITLSDLNLDVISFGDSSSIINTALLESATIIEAINSSSEGSVLIKILVYAMQSNGQYGEEAVGYFYYLVDFFIPVSGITLNNGTQELFTYNTIGDKFVGSNNISRSIGSFSVNINTVYSGLTPTYINNLKIFVNGNEANILNYFNDNVLFLNIDGGISANENSAALKIIKSFKDNVFTFEIQALRYSANYVFGIVLSEINENKKFTAISRVIAKEAVEIEDIELINANEENPIYVQNNLKTVDNFENETQYYEYLNEIFDNPYQLEIIYNIYSNNGNEITNPSLEFEIEYDESSNSKNYYLDQNGNKINFIQILDDDGRTNLKVIKAAWDYSGYYSLSEEDREQTTAEEEKKLVQFGANAVIKIYPTSNYYEVFGGCNGEEPIVFIPIIVADGLTSSTAFQLYTEDDLNLLGEYPASKFVIMTNITMSADNNFKPVESFSGELRGIENFSGGVPSLITNKPLFKEINENGVVKNFAYIMTGNTTTSSSELEIDYGNYKSTKDGISYFGGLANINNGQIINVGGTPEFTEEAYSIISTAKMKNKADGLYYSASLLVISWGFPSLQSWKNQIVADYEISAGENVKYTGGLVGLNNGTIESSNEFKINANYSLIIGANVGGIVGVNNGSINGLDFFGSILATESSGGIVALNRGEINNCNVKASKIEDYPLDFSGLIITSIISDEIYSYDNENIKFAAGGIVAISEGGIINSCSFQSNYLKDSEGDESYSKFNQDTIASIKTINSENLYDFNQSCFYKKSYVGGLVGILEDTKLNQSFFDGALGFRYSKAGGLVGKLIDDGDESSYLVENCYAILGYENNSIETSIAELEEYLQYGYLDRFGTGLFVSEGHLGEIKYCYASSNNERFGYGYANLTGETVGSFKSATKNSNLSSILDVFNKKIQISGYDLIELSDKNISYFKNNYKYTELNAHLELSNSTENIKKYRLEGDIIFFKDYSPEKERIENFGFTINVNEDKTIDIVSDNEYIFEGIYKENENIKLNLIYYSYNDSFRIIFEKNNYSEIIGEFYLTNDSQDLIYSLYDDTKFYLNYNQNSFYQNFGKITDANYEIYPVIGGIGLTYYKLFQIFLAQNYEELVKDETWSGVSFEGNSGITGQEIRTMISKYFNGALTKEGVDLFVEEYIISDNDSEDNFDKTFELIKADIESFSTSFIANYQLFIDTAELKLTSEQITELNEKKANYQEIINKCKTYYNETLSLTTSELRSFVINGLKPIYDLLMSYYFDIILYEDVFDDPDISGTPFYNSYLCMVYPILLEGINEYLFTSVNAIYSFDPDVNKDLIPENIDGFIDAGWDIKNKYDIDGNYIEDDSIWVYEQGKLPTLRENNEEIRIKDFDIVLNPNNFDKDKLICNDEEIILYYYDVADKNLLNNKQQGMLLEKNLIKISDVVKFININGVPGLNLGEEKFLIQSSNRNVIRILNGAINVVGTGKTTLTITPFFGPVFADKPIKTLTIYVIYPFGETKIYNGISSESGVNSSNLPINNKEDIVFLKGENNYITIKTENELILENTTYKYLTNISAFDVVISHFNKDNELVVDYSNLQDNEKNNFNVLGLAGEDSGKFIEGTLTLILKEGVLEDTNYKFELKTLLQSKYQPYKNFEGDLKEFISQVNGILLNKFTENFHFNVSIRAEKLLVSIKSAEIDPSTVISADAELHTNRNEDYLKLIIRDENDQIVWETNNEEVNDSSIFDVYAPELFEKTSPTDGKLKGNILISVKESKRPNITSTEKYFVHITDSQENVSYSFEFVLKPQKVINVVYTHNNRTDNSTEDGIAIQDEPSSILNPGDFGILTIGMYPTYSSFSRIVIESEIINDKHYVLMEQMYYSDNGYFKPTSTTSGYNSERNANVLTIYKPTATNITGNNIGNIFVKTKILSDVKEGLYFPLTITIYAVDENGNEYIVKTETITLVSEVINGANITINGEKEAVVARGNNYSVEISVDENQSLANYTLVDYDKDIELANDIVTINFNTNEYELIDGRKIYTGTLNIGLDAELNGDGIFKIQTIVQKIINGRLESSTDYVEVRVVDFIVEGIKIKGQDENDNVFNTPVAIEKDLVFDFILSKTPEKISSNQTESINRIEMGKKEFIETLAFKQYYYNDGGNKIYQYLINTDRVFSIVDQDDSKLTHQSLTQRTIAYDLYYSSDLTPFINSSNEVQENRYFTLKYNGDSNGNVIDANTLKVIGKTVGSNNMTIRIGYRLPNSDFDQYITYNFTINVQTYSDEDKPTPIETAEQFVSYLQSENDQYLTSNFILMNDIVLEDFIPFEKTNFESLDGNNKVITIKNFNLTQMTNQLNIGLFKTISQNSTVKNLVVNYSELESIYVDENVFSSVNFGGIAVFNNGIVYNCEVVSINLSNTEANDNNGINIYFNHDNQDASKNEETEVQIAGLIVENSQTGSITNSRVGGKDYFTKVEYSNDSIEKTEYEYNKINIIGQGNISGFVISNSGVISASYFANGFIENKTISGEFCATAGFAIQNLLGGVITGCYVEGTRLPSDNLEISISGGGIVAQGVSAGFIYINSGNIADCYSNIKLAGNSTGRLVSGFVYNNTITGVVARCYSASQIVGELTTQMPFTGKDAKDNSLQENPNGIVNSYYIVEKLDTDTLLEKKYNTGATAIQKANLTDSIFYGFAMASDQILNSGIWIWNTTYGYPELISANNIAISVRRIIKNYSSIISGGTSTQNLDIFPYIQGYEYGTEKNPIIIRSADEFNRVFGQETNLNPNTYYAISQMYNKDLGIVFGNYRLVSHIDFNNLSIVENVKISSSIMKLTNNGGYTGAFDGNGLNIYNVEIALDNQSSIGLFSSLSNGASLKNLTLTVITVAGSGKTVYAGSVAGLVQDSYLSNITVSPVNESGENRSRISGQNIVGGIAGAVLGNSKISNLVSSISVVSGYKMPNKEGIDYYTQTVLRNNKIVENGVIVDQNSSYSLAGGVIGVLDIYEDITDNSITFSNPNAIRLSYFGNNVSIQACFVGGVVGYVGASTYLADASFILTGDRSSLNQRLISYNNTIGGVVGINYGELFELRIEYEDEIQQIIESNMQNYYNNNSNIFRGNTKLYNSTGDSLEYIGGLVGQMKKGSLSVSYSRVDVSASASDYAGGIIGLNESSTEFVELYSYGDVSGKVAGGIIGSNNANASFDKCVAFSFYSKDNTNINDAISSANDFNSGNLTLNGYSVNGNTHTFTFTNGITLKILNSNVENPNYYYIIKDKITEKGSITQWHLANVVVYTYNEDSSSYVLVKEKLYNDPDRAFLYYYKNGESKKYVMYEGLDGKLYKYNSNPESEIIFGDTNDTKQNLEFETKNNDKIFNKNVDFELSSEDSSKIDSLILKNVGGLVGKNLETVTVAVSGITQNSVYANKLFNYNGYNILISLDNIENKEKVLNLTVNLNDYRGYELDAQLVNKMFFGSDWNPELWELKDNLLFPTFNYQITKKVLYIEKPLDILKIKDYWKIDNVVIFGDDPATVFNPYEYSAANRTTWGEFTEEELDGLEVEVDIDNKNKNIILDFDAIRDKFLIGYSDYYFSKFLGRMYGETNSEGYKFVLKNVEKALFNLVYGGEISNLSFTNAEGRETLNPILANRIDAYTDLTNLHFENIKIKSERKVSGILANEMINIVNLQDISIINSEIISETEEEISAGAVAGKIENEDAVNVENLKINIKDFNITVKDNIPAKVGGVFGESAGSFTISNVVVENVNIVIESDTNNNNQTNSIDSTDLISYYGGLVGNASGDDYTIKNIKDNDHYKIVEGVKISIGNGDVTYAGLLFGNVETLTMLSNNSKYSIIVSGAINSLENSSSAIRVGGVAGQAGSVNAENVEINYNLIEEGTEKDIELIFNTYSTTTTTTTSTSTNKTTSDTISSFGGMIGFVTGEVKSLKNISFNNNKSINITNQDEKEDEIVIVGGIIGSAIGGIGTANIETETANGETKENSIGNITSNINVSVDYENGTQYVGGFVGGAYSNSYITDVRFSGEILIKGVKNLYAGGILGWGLESETKTNISNCKVSGNISINGAETTSGAKSYSLRGSNIYVGGIAGAIIDGNISNNYAWGNVEINKQVELFNDNDDYSISKLQVGGILGTVSNKIEFKGNHSLTSIYVIQRASQHFVQALIGYQMSEDKIVDDKDNKDNMNYYCHQINLATDSFGENLYYNDNKYNGILSKFDSVKAKEEPEGSKLNPTTVDSNSISFEAGKYYVLSDNINITTSKELNGHLVGNGFTITSKITPFTTINGYISGFKFNLNSETEGGNAGRINAAKDSAPSGVAKTNNGIIFAVLVEGRGYKNENNSFGNVLYSINSGIATENNGLISDSGVVLNVKSAYAGISANNTGVISNSYVTGAVHQGATYAFSNDEFINWSGDETSAVERDEGIIYNSYAAIKAENVVAGKKLDHFFYDKYATEKVSGNGSKDTNYMSTVNGNNTSILTGKKPDTEEKVDRLLGDIWKQDSSINFGYPYLGSRAYNRFGYLAYSSSSSSYSYLKGEKDGTQGGIVENIKYDQYKFVINGKEIWVWEVKFSESLTLAYYKFIKENIEYKDLTELEALLGIKIFYLSNLGTLVNYEGGKALRLLKQGIQIPNPGKLAQLQHSETGTGSNKYSDWGAKYVLLADMNLDVIYPESEDESENYLKNSFIETFSGVFDGNNYHIYNIPSIAATSAETTTGTGFFGENSGTIRDIHFIYKNEATIQGDQYVGGVVGKNNAGRLINITSSGAQIQGDQYVGGIVGSSTGIGYVSGAVNFNEVLEGEVVGGIVGESDNTAVQPVLGSTNYGEISGKIAGGIVGIFKRFRVSSCYNYGNVTGTQIAGGIVGQIDGDGVEVTNCYNEGNITAEQSAGGIVGSNIKQTTTPDNEELESINIARGGSSSHSQTIFTIENMTLGVEIINWDAGNAATTYIYLKNSNSQINIYTVSATAFDVTKTEIQDNTSNTHYYMDNEPGLEIKIDPFYTLTIESIYYFALKASGVTYASGFYMGGITLAKKYDTVGTMTNNSSVGKTTVNLANNFNEVELEGAGTLHQTGVFIGDNGPVYWLQRGKGNLGIGNLGIIDLSDNSIEGTIPYEEGKSSTVDGYTFTLPGGNVCEITNSNASINTKHSWAEHTSNPQNWNSTTTKFNVYTAGELAWIAKNINEGIIDDDVTINLMNDIDLSAYNWEWMFTTTTTMTMKRSYGQSYSGQTKIGSQDLEFSTTVDWPCRLTFGEKTVIGSSRFQTEYTIYSFTIGNFLIEISGEIPDGSDSGDYNVVISGFNFEITANGYKIYGMK